MCQPRERRRRPRTNSPQPARVNTPPRTSGQLLLAPVSASSSVLLAADELESDEVALVVALDVDVGELVTDGVVVGVVVGVALGDAAVTVISTRKVDGA